MRRAPLVLFAVLLLASPASADEIRYDAKSPLEWAETLVTGEKRFRIPAAQALNDHLHPYATSAIPVLVTALDSEVGEVRQLAASCLGRIGAEARGETATKLAALLADPEGHVRCAAAGALGAIGDPATLGTLREALDIEDAELRACAARGLGLYGAAAATAVPALEARLEDESAAVRLRAALALVRITGEVGPAREAIQAALATPSGPTSRAQVYLREEAIQTLGEIGPTAGEFAAALTEVVETDRSFARDFAAASLARLGPEGYAGIPALVEGLSDSTFRLAAAKALAGFGPAAAPAVPGLVKLLERPTWKEETEIAVRALGRIGPGAREAVPALVSVLTQGDDGRAESALVALGDIGPAASAALSAVKPFLTAKNDVLRVAALRTTHRLTGEGKDDVLAALLAALGSEDVRVRLGAATALGGLGPLTDEARSALEAREIEDPDAAVRRAAASALRASP